MLVSPSMSRRALSCFLLLSALACSKKPPMEKPAEQTCLTRYQVHRDGGLDLGDVTVVASVETDATKMSPAGMVETTPSLRIVPLAAAEDFHAVLWRLREGGIRVSKGYASDLTIVDLPRLARAKETKVIGRLTPTADLGRRELVELLLASHIARSFWHMEATLCLLEEEAPAGGVYRARFHAEHHYYTNEHVSPEYRFSLTVAPDGLISAVGEWHED